MKKTRIVIASALLALASANSIAKDDTLHFPLQDVIDSADGKAALDGSVKFYLDAPRMVP